MKRYGMMKATEFTKKQINVIYAKAKNGELAVERWFLSKMYDLADYYGYDYNGSAAREEDNVLRILENVFANDTAAAQEKIDLTTNSWYNSYTDKYKATFDRSLVK